MPEGAAPCSAVELMERKMRDLWHDGKRYRIHKGHVYEVAYEKPYAAPGERHAFFRKLVDDKFADDLKLIAEHLGTLPTDLRYA
jgi:hypothetical protein